MNRSLHLVFAALLLGGCDNASNPTGTNAASAGPCAVRVGSARAALSCDGRTAAPPADLSATGLEINGDVGLRRDLETLRRVTARFHRFKDAAAAGWSSQITPCMTDPADSGGMGFHYGNTALIDGSVQVDQPELLLYEPEAHGRLSLVAVEYIIPYTAHSRASAPPVLFGQQFKQNDTFQLWGLHVWVWKANPRGLFANWNPRVTCTHTDDIAVMAH